MGRRRVVVRAAERYGALRDGEPGLANPAAVRRGSVGRRHGRYAACRAGAARRGRSVPEPWGRERGGDGGTGGAGAGEEYHAGGDAVIGALHLVSRRSLKDWGGPYGVQKIGGFGRELAIGVLSWRAANGIIAGRFLRIFGRHSCTSTSCSLLAPRRFVSC